MSRFTWSHDLGRALLAPLPRSAGLIVISDLDTFPLWYMQHVERYRQFGAFPASGTRIVVRITRSDEHRAFSDMEFLDESGALVARIEGCESVIDPALAGAFRNRHLEEARP